jgi:hypothetical protein
VSTIFGYPPPFSIRDIGPEERWLVLEESIAL